MTPSMFEGEEIWEIGSNTMKNSIKKTSGLRVKTVIKAGGLGSSNHNGALTNKTSGLRVKTVIKAGGLGSSNHNGALVLAR